jgi:CRISPR/Cas system-associated exonuclease Cas4 (RecB family)
MGRSWKASLREGAPVSKAKLRFNIPRVPISSIAEQFYCEAKVDLKYRFGEVPKLAKEEGARLHEEVLAMERTTLEDMISSIEQKPYYVCRFLVHSQIDDLAVVGEPDAILFQCSKPSHIIELKTSVGSVGRLWRDQVVQAKAYGLALDSMGFDCENLRLSIVRIDRSKGISEGAKMLIFRGVISALKVDRAPELEKAFKERLGIRLKIHTLKYCREDALEDIRWAGDYWLMRREAVPTKNPSKCRVCEFERMCSYKSYTQVGST